MASNGVVSELWELLGFSVAMLAGCFGAGLLPISFPLSEQHIQLCNSMGAGLLVGTALAVIIPEGMHTMYSMPASPHEAGEEHEHGHEHGGGCEAPMHSYIGVVLVIGFLFQLLVDKVAMAKGHTHAAPGEASLPNGNSSSQGRSGRAVAATIGLVVHSAADGIALGAAVAAAKSSLEFLVFIAIMLHKAPASFGLVSFLLGEGVDKRVIRKHLLAFSIAAPAMAIFTYIVIKSYAVAAPLEDEAAADTSTSPITGLALLFSGGTFLYVATVHVLPEVISQNARVATEAADTGAIKGGLDLNRQQLMAVCVGALLPLVLSAGHSH